MAKRLLTEVSMAERRRQARKKRRFLIEVEMPGAVSTGFTYDMSPSAIFIRSIRIPRLGSPVTARLSLPDGTRVALHGLVQRSFRAPAAIARLIPSGFSLVLAEPPEGYRRLLSTL